MGSRARKSTASSRLRRASDMAGTLVDGWPLPRCCQIGRCGLLLAVRSRRACWPLGESQGVAPGATVGNRKLVRRLSNAGTLRFPTLLGRGQGGFFLLWLKSEVLNAELRTAWRAGYSPHRDLVLIENFFRVLVVSTAGACCHRVAPRARPQLSLLLPRRPAPALPRRIRNAASSSAHSRAARCS